MLTQSKSTTNRHF